MAKAPRAAIRTTEDALYRRIAGILERARSLVARTINTAMGLGEHPVLRERDLEQAIIDRLEGFLLEMGRGFCFVARQKRITLEGDHYDVDLVLYNRLLRAFVLVDLKMGKLTHQDLGQMQMYVHYFDRFQRADHEARTIGIVLCSEKNDAMVRITLPDDNEQVVAASYQTCRPTEDELRNQLARERTEAERVLRLTGDAAARPTMAAAASGVRRARPKDAARRPRRRR